MCPVQVLLLTAFSMIGPILTTVAPYRLRGMVTAVGGLYVFFVGAFGGAVLAAVLDSLFDVRTAVLIIMIPSTLIGALLIIRSAHFIKNDLSLVVVEIQEEMEEHKRQQANPADIPVLALSGIDFSYGHVQILFGVNFEVKRGEVLALLGTNGAGKSTALRVASGLETPSRGVVRLNGQDITYTTPEQRSRLGIHLLPGGKGVFGEMTIAENLEMGGFVYRSDQGRAPPPHRARLCAVPGVDGPPQGTGGLAVRRDAADAGTGHRHAPRSRRCSSSTSSPSGWLRSWSKSSSSVVEGMKAEGVTLIIVEQSLNVAAAIADRAVFLEKGRVRFEGQIRDLMERDDLARAVFLGGREDE